MTKVMCLLVDGCMNFIEVVLFFESRYSTFVLVPGNKELVE